MAGTAATRLLHRLGNIRELPTAAAPAPASALAPGSSTGGRRVYPVLDPLTGLFPGGGLRAGSVVAVRGSLSLLFAVIAAATTRGTWAAVIGVTDLGVLAAAETGVAVQRLVLVPQPGPDPVAVTAALLDGIGLVALSDAGRLPAGARRTLAARARQRAAVLLPLDGWPGADIELSCRAEEWSGPQAGAGRLRARQVSVHATGRGAASRRRCTRLLLPGPDGAVGPVTTGQPDREVRAVG